MRYDRSFNNDLTTILTKWYMFVSIGQFSNVVCYFFLLLRRCVVHWRPWNGMTVLKVNRTDAICHLMAMNNSYFHYGVIGPKCIICYFFINTYWCFIGFLLMTSTSLIFSFQTNPLGLFITHLICIWCLVAPYGAIDWNNALFPESTEPYLNK